MRRSARISARRSLAACKADDEGASVDVEDKKISNKKDAGQDEEERSLKTPKSRRKGNLTRSTSDKNAGQKSGVEKKLSGKKDCIITVAKIRDFDEIETEKSDPNADVVVDAEDAGNASKKMGNKNDEQGIFLKNTHSARKQSRKMKTRSESFNEEVEEMGGKLSAEPGVPESREVTREKTAAFEIISKEEVDINGVKEAMNIKSINSESNQMDFLPDSKSCEVVESKCSEFDKREQISAGGICTDVEELTDKRSTKNGSKHSKIDRSLNLERLKISSSFLKEENCKGNILKLTSEIFQKLPFKLTKDDLMGKRLCETNNKKTTLMQNEEKCKEEDDIMQKDVISVMVETNDASNQKRNMVQLSSQLNAHVESNDLYFNITESRTAPVKGKIDKSKSEEKKILKKSAVGPDFEQKEHSNNHESSTQKMKKRKEKNEETAGPGWYNLPKTEMTEEIKKDLQLIRMRSILDPKRFYKKGDKKISKYVMFLIVVHAELEVKLKEIMKMYAND